MTDEHFPSSFDLWFDIKSRQDLIDHYRETKRELVQIERVMRDHGMEFTEEEMHFIDGDDEPGQAPSM